MPKALVSIIIPSYNRFEGARRATQSALSQQVSSVDIEVILVNDGSTDSRYYEKWPNVTVIHLERNTRDLLGFPSAGFVRNCGIRVSRGDYIAFLDDDDVLLPTKVETQIQAMRTHHALVSCTDAWKGAAPFEAQKVYSRYHDVYASFYQHKLGRHILPQWIDAKLLKKHNVLITSTVVFHKSLLTNRLFREDLAMGGKNKQNIYLDYDFWQYLASLKPILYIAEPLSFYDDDHAGAQQY